MQKLNVLKSRDGVQAPVANGVVGRSKVSISPNLIRVSERLDKDGNVIDPRTKQIIKLAGN
jgi:hypothetical protein